MIRMLLARIDVKIFLHILATSPVQDTKCPYIPKVQSVAQRNQEDGVIVSSHLCLRQVENYFKATDVVSAYHRHSFIRLLLLYLM